MPRAATARTEGANPRPVPFNVLRNSRESLTAQLIAGFKRAIASGYYRRGERLPRAQDIAAELGVSFKVMRTAYARLAAGGLISPRRRFGTIVTGGDLPLYQGRVLMVLPDADDCFYQNVLAGALRRRLTEAGYLFAQEVVRTDARGRYDFSKLDFSISQGTTLAIQMFDRPKISRHLAKAGVPWLLIGDGPKPPAGCAGLIRVGRTDVMEAFAAHCRQAGVRSVLQVGVIPKDADARPALAAAGVRAEEWLVYSGTAFQHIDEVQRCTVDAFEARFAREGRAWLPELIFFKDDFVATAGMMALLRNGVRVPEDVRVVTWANKGLGPVYSRTFTRLEMDPVAHGERVSEIVLRHLRGRPFRPDEARLSPAYVVGDTFALPSAGSGCA